jgi:hypothetical protein
MGREVMTDYTELLELARNIEPPKVSMAKKTSKRKRKNTPASKLDWDSSAPGVVRSGKTITLSEWKRRQKNGH